MKRTIPFLIIVGAVFAVYAPALHNGFVWDDTALILRDPLIRSWRLIPEGFNHFLFTDATVSDFYRPVQRVVYTLIYCGFAFNPVAFHLVSILAHAAAAVALFIFVREFFRTPDFSERRAAALALVSTVLWAIHPVHNAAVAYAAGIADPLAAMFGFAACYLILRGVRSTGPAQLVALALASLLFLLSVLSKESGFIFIAIAALLLALRRNWTALWKIGVGALFVFTIYSVLRFSAEHNPAPLPHDPAPLAERPLTMSRAVAEYAGLLVLPTNLHMDRQLEANPHGEGDARMNSGAWREIQTVAGLALIGLTTWWILRIRRRSRPEFVLLVLAVVAYLPVSGIWSLNAAVAEHWLYLPSAFLFGAAALAVIDFNRRHTSGRVVHAAFAAVVLLWGGFLATRTFVHTFDWKDQRTFLEHTIASGGDSARMLINLGGLELSEGHLDKAKAALQAALKKEPQQPIGVINLATVAIKQNDFATARALLNRATELPLVDGKAHELLAVLESKETGNGNLMRMRLASRTGPPDWSIEKRYIRLLDEAGSTGGAIREVEHCLATEWYRAESWLLLSELLKKSGHPDKAAQAFDLAQRYDQHLIEHAL